MGSPAGELGAGAVAAMLPVLFPRDLRMRVSHETIYQSLFVQTKGELKRELTSHLRSQRQRREAQTGGAKRSRWGSPMRCGSQPRPAEATDRAVPGHWDGDLLLGGVGKGAVITLVERSSPFVLLAPLQGRHTTEIARMTLTQMMPRSRWICASRSPGTADPRWPNTPGSRPKPGSRSTSATPNRRGSAAQTRTPTGCCVSTGPRAPTYASLTITECDSRRSAAQHTTPQDPRMADSRPSPQPEAR